MAVRLYMPKDCDTAKILPVISTFCLSGNNDNLTFPFLLHDGLGLSGDKDRRTIAATIKGENVMVMKKASPSGPALIH